MNKNKGGISRKSTGFRVFAHSRPKLKFLILGFLSLFLCAAFLSAQGLVELAKKEKERRDGIKGKSGKVVTYDDLKRAKGKWSFSVGPAEPGAGAEPEQSVYRPSVSREPAPAPSRFAQEPNDAGLPNPKYATEILEETLRVENARNAIDRPDGKFAAVAHFGMLDLELNAKNGPGDDIAIYADRTAEGILPEFMVYGVLAMGDDGEWTEIGQGTGITRPEKFDLGGLSSIKKLRIVFKLPSEGDILTKNLKLYSEEYTIGIDAVEALH